MKNTRTSKVIGALVGVGVVIALAGGCDPESTDTANPSAVPAADGTFAAAPVESPEANPYNTDGTWLVPVEIAVGDYRAVQRPGSIMGYVKICRDAACEIGTDGFIDNAAVNGSSVISIPADAKYIELQGVELQAL